MLVISFLLMSGAFVKFIELIQNIGTKWQDYKRRHKVMLKRVLCQVVSISTALQRTGKSACDTAPLGRAVRKTF